MITSASRSTAEWRDSLVEIVPDLYLVPGESEGRFPFAHSILIEGEGQTLIDTGAGIQRLRRLRGQVSLDMVIASHSHPDHTAGDWLFDGLPLYAPEQAADTFGRLEPLSKRFIEPTPLAALWRQFMRQQMGFRDAPPTHTFGDGHTFDFGRVRLVALHTPGHVIDHTCFFEPTYGVLLAFDIDLTSFGPWYGHRESDIEQFKASIRRVMALEPRVVVSSHKGIIHNDVQGRLARYLAVFDEREAKIRELLAAGYTIAEMVDLSPFYGGHPYAPDLLRYFEEQMIRKHVESCLDEPTRPGNPAQSPESGTVS
jgi:glyoxylase-like metal-dependent hydrolase (beta-lactamase superfamily II)